MLSIVDSFVNNRHRAFEKHEVCVVNVISQNVAIRAFERGTSHHDAAVLGATILEAVADGIQPWPPVFVVEGLPSRHEFDVLLRMKLVCVAELVSESLRQHLADSAFTRAGYTHHHDRSKRMD
ncbi:hypothetical protein BKA04_001933 [Cryobacterium mesophilum]|nr:hypothetical protein [Terrimesophilobacter mesophilus]